MALALTGCETTQEKAAKLQFVDAQHEREVALHRQHGLSITQQSTRVRVTATAVLHTSEGAAAVVILRNVSGTALRDLPLEITVRGAHGGSVYTNATPGLAAGLASASLIAAHGTLTWIDDQVQASAVPVSVSAKIGEGAPAMGSIPRIDVEGTHLIEDPTNGPGAEGSVVNRSQVTQEELVVYAVARRAGRIVAAGRAVLPTAPASATTRFQLFFIGDPRGAQLEVSAPATTLG